MARNVSDLALFLDAMTGFEASQPLTIESPRVSFQDELKSAGPDVRIAYAPTWAVLRRSRQKLKPSCAVVLSDFRASVPRLKRRFPT